jgi:hypothetical protein
LEVTEQQFDIIDTIIHLQRNKEVANPKRIIEENARLHDEPKIQRSNFFSQLKKLQERGLVKKLGEASYGANYDCIKDSLDSAQGKLIQEMDDIENVRKNTVDYFKSLAIEDTKPTVEFYGYDDMLGKLGDQIKTATSCRITGFFPKILYANSPALMGETGGRKYAMMAWDRCIREEKLQMTYLTHLDIEYLYNRLLSVYKQPDMAHEESVLVLNNMERLLEKSPKLKIFYIKSPYGVDMVVPEWEELKSFFIIVRDERHTGMGAVYLDFPALAIRFRNMFDQECGRAVDLSGKKGKKVVEQLRNKLDKLYSKKR